MSFEGIAHISSLDYRWFAFIPPLPPLQGYPIFTASDPHPSVTFSPIQVNFALSYVNGSLLFIKKCIKTSILWGGSPGMERIEYSIIIHIHTYSFIFRHIHCSTTKDFFSSGYY